MAQASPTWAASEWPLRYLVELGDGIEPKPASRKSAWVNSWKLNVRYRSPPTTSRPSALSAQKLPAGMRLILVIPSAIATARYRPCWRDHPGHRSCANPGHSWRNPKRTFLLLARGGQRRAPCRGPPPCRTCTPSPRVLSVGMRGLLALFVLAFAATPADAGDALFDAIAAGNKAAVEQALADGADVDSRARDQATPLIAAALDDQLAIAELLLSKGADVMARNSGGLHPAPRGGLFRKPADRQAAAREGRGARRCGQQVGRHAAHGGG